jgi:hypothetical protein
VTAIDEFATKRLAGRAELWSARHSSMTRSSRLANHLRPDWWSINRKSDRLSNHTASFHGETGVVRHAGEGHLSRPNRRALCSSRYARHATVNYEIPNPSHNMNMPNESTTGKVIRVRHWYLRVVLLKAQVTFTQFAERHYADRRALLSICCTPAAPGRKPGHQPEGQKSRSKPTMM